MGTDDDNQLVFAYIHHDESCLETIPEDKLRDECTIYQAFYVDIQKGAKTPNQISAKKFAERWENSDSDGFEENSKRLENITRLESLERRKSLSPGF